MLRHISPCYVFDEFRKRHTITYMPVSGMPRVGLIESDNICSFRGSKVDLFFPRSCRVQEDDSQQYVVSGGTLARLLLIG